MSKAKGTKNKKSEIKKIRVSFRIDEKLIEAIDQEAIENERDRTKQIVRILKERYGQAGD